MKNFEKLLHYAKRLEQFHLRGRAREINDIEKFDTQKERRKAAALDRMLSLEAAIDENRGQSLAAHEQMMRQAEEENVQRLIELDEFAQQARASHDATAGNEFNVIADIQGFTYHHERSQLLKQLPEASVDIFEHELTELTETELQQELDDNRKAVQGTQQRLELRVETSDASQHTSAEHLEEVEDDHDEPATVFFFRPPKEPRK